MDKYIQNRYYPFVMKQGFKQKNFSKEIRKEIAEIFYKFL